MWVAEVVDQGEEQGPEVEIEEVEAEVKEDEVKVKKDETEGKVAEEKEKIGAEVSLGQDFVDGPENRDRRVRPWTMVDNGEVQKGP